MSLPRHLWILTISILTSMTYFGQSASSTYNSGNIPVNYLSYSNTCNGPVTPLVVNIPAGSIVTGVDVSYDMTAVGSGWMSDQQSQIYCQETGNNEGGYTAGVGNSTGTYSYNRAGLTLANGVSATGTLTFEMHAYRTYGTTPACGTDYNYVNNNSWTVTVYYNVPGPLAYSSSTTTQNNTNSVYTCGSNQEIIGLEVDVTGSTGTLNLTQIQMNMNGSSNTGDATNIDIFYSGTSSSFSTGTLFGTATPGGGTLTINGSISLSNGTNYFWVAYDINSGATVSNVLDAQCTQITVGGSNYTPTVTSPAGSRTIVACEGSPGGITADITVWLDAGKDIFTDAGVTAATNGTAVQQWNEQSGNPSVTTFTQTTAANKPTYYDDRFNYNPAIYLDGGDFIYSSFVSYSAFTNGDRITSYMVAKRDAGSTFFAWDDNGGPNKYAMSSSGGCYFDGSNSNPANYGTCATQPYLKSIVAENNTLQGYDLNAAHTSNTVLDFSGAITSPLCVGRLYHHGFSSTGDFAEVIIYDASHTAAERQLVSTYLAVKYGLTLGTNGTSQDYAATNGNVVWDISANPGYNYDITGIGIDDASGLDQSKSHTENLDGSGNSRDIVTIANGTNFSSPSSLTADRSYLIWGHNDGVLEGNYSIPTVLTTNSETIETIFKRHWKTQETGTVGTVTLQFDMSSISGVGGVAGANDLANLRLLVDADGDFTSGAMSISPSAFNNTTDIVEFQHNFIGASGAYFTLGSIDFENTPLPMNLLSFDAQPINDEVYLTWETSSDNDNNLYVVERSTDGSNWTVVVAYPATYSSSNNYYSDYDVDPIDGISYYRIKIIGAGEKSSYSEIKAVNFKTESKLEVYPNPNSGNFSLQLKTENSQPLYITLKDIQGRFIFSEIKNASSGQNLFDFSIDQSLPNGTYYLFVQSEDKILQEQQRIVITK